MIYRYRIGYNRYMNMMDYDVKSYEHEIREVLYNIVD